MIFTQTKFVSFPAHQRPNCYCRRALIHRLVSNNIRKLKINKIVTLIVFFFAKAVDRAKNTPLHIIVTYKKIVSDFLTLHAIVMALLEAGVHIDSVNAAGQTPLGAATTGVAEIILKSQADMSLKCLAAQSIRKYNINYIGQVQKTLD